MWQIFLKCIFFDEKSVTFLILSYYKGEKRQKHQEYEFGFIHYIKESHS